MISAPRSPRRGAAILAVFVVSLFGLVPAAGAQDAATPVSSGLTQDGWWNRAKGPQPSEPANPLRSNIGGSIPAPSTVPDNGLGVGAAAGEPDKVAAVGIILEAPADALVDKLTLSLKEATTPNGSQINSASAKIVACPITGFWAGVKNGDFVNRPMCDVGQSIPGSRAADGTWTFDLTVLASQWIDPSSGLTQNGVVLMESVDAPISFQTSLLDIASGTVKLDFSATTFPPVEEFTSDESFTSTETFDSGTTFEDVPVADVPTETFDDSASFSSEPSTFTPTRTPRAAVTTPAAVPTGAPQVATPAAAVGIAAPATLFGNLPPFAVIFFVLVLAGVALFLGMVLGPLAAPTVAPVRAGGVSRALAARDAARANR